MHPPDSFARGALDTLPFRVAVLDGTGDVIFVNEAWEAFESDSTRDWRGTPYVSAVDLDEEAAERAGGGIRSVLDGESAEFSMEYRRDGESGQRWFLLRASPFELGTDRGVAVVHVDITERKLAEMEADSTADMLREEHARLQHLIDRINGLVEDVTGVVVGAESRVRMEEDVCDAFAGTDPYVAAWIGHLDLARERLRPQSAGGCDPGRAFADADLELRGEDLHPAARAVVDDAPQVIEDPAVLDADPVVAGMDDPGRIEAIAALPLTYRGTRYGALALYVTDAEEVDDRETVVLSALARILTHGINARETKRNLAGAAGVELSFQIGDEEVVANALSATVDGQLEFRGSIDHDGREVVAFFTLSEGDPDSLSEATEIAGVRDVDTLAVHEDTALVEVTADSLIGTDLAEYGASLRELGSEGGRTRATVELPGETTARSVYDLLTERYDRVELVAYHEQERPERTAPEFRTRLTDRLTTRQLTVLQKAYLGGYYESNREVTGTELAESMGISRATFHQHLRAAERKVLAEFFDA